MAHRQSIPMRRFERMSRLRDYTLEKGAADPRGWKVHDAAGNAVGVVRDLVVDTDRMTAAYVDVELDLRTFDLREDPRILVPMTRAHQEGRERRLVVPELTRSRVAAMYTARAEHELRFWDGWWQESRSDARDADTTTAFIAPELQTDRARPMNDVGAPIRGEDRIDRRLAHPDERIAAYDRDPRDVPDRDFVPRDVAPPERDYAPRRDIPPPRRRFDE